MRKKRILTAEQKEAKRLNGIIYRAKNKEKIAIKKKQYREANKELIAETFKKWREKNKERVNAKKSYDYELSKLDYHIVYCLHNYNGLGGHYVGITTEPITRMRSHKSQGRDVSNWLILDYADTREEASILERQYHNKGYDGAYGYRQVA